MTKKLRNGKSSKKFIIFHLTSIKIVWFLIILYSYYFLFNKYIYLFLYHDMLLIKQFLDFTCSDVCEAPIITSIHIFQHQTLNLWCFRGFLIFLVANTKTF